MINYQGDKTYKIFCLSTDVKPTLNASSGGSYLFEIDTGKTYIYNSEGQSWVEYSESGGGSSVDPTYRKTEVVFYDFDGTVLYKYTQEEFEALTALPALPNRVSENLTCEGWNYTLDEAKKVSSDVGSCQIGAMYHTTDGSDYFHIRLTTDNKSVSLGISTSSITIDWGDGTITTSGKSHTYSSMGDYEIKLTSASAYKISGYLLGSQSENYNLVGDVRLSSNMTKLDSYAFKYCYSLTSVTIPSSVTSIGDYAFKYCTSLTSVAIPSSVTSIGNDAFQNCTSLSSVDLSSNENPPTLPSLSSIGFDSNYTRTIYYVASSSLSAFSTATNWSTIYAKGLIRVKEGA